MTDADRDEAKTAERSAVLQLLEDGVREAHRKVESGRVRDIEREKVRIQWIRALAYSAGQYRQLKNDEELDELAERIETIEQQNQGQRQDAAGRTGSNNFRVK